MKPATPAYSHPLLLRTIQRSPPEHINAVHAVHEAEALVRDMRQALVQAEQHAAGTGTATAEADHPSPTGALSAGSKAAGDAACLLAPDTVG